MNDRMSDMDADRPILRRRLRDEALAEILATGKHGVSIAELMMLNEAVATTMLEHPEWVDA